MYYQFNGSFEFSVDAWDAGSVIIGTIGQEQEIQEDELPYVLEELLAMGQGEYVDIQFISTPRQIVLLFQTNSGTSIGVYYDIQLGRYSGLGMSN